MAAIAALLHDVGHGLLSHVFEGVQRVLRKPRSHEDWTREIIQGDTEIHKLLDEHDSDLASDVARVIGRKDPADIFDGVVSSQFDADRLDYLQRDRYMAGTHTGGFDFSWLLDCLEVGQINIGLEDEYVEVDGLYLNHKGLAPAEGYVLARFHLYSQVYLHKTTRSAERMLAALLYRVADLFKNELHDSTGLRDHQPISQFFQQEKPNLQSYLAPDDPAIWSALVHLSEAKDELVRTFALGLLYRRLYKCLDIGEIAKQHGSDAVAHFKRRLQEEFGARIGDNMLKDEATLTAYGVHQYEDPSAFQKVLIGRPDASGKSDDLAERSEIVKSIRPQRIFRVYCSDGAELQEVEQLWKEVIK